MPTYYEYHPAYQDWIGVSTEFSGYSTTTVATSSGAGQTSVWNGTSWNGIDDQRGVYFYTFSDNSISIGSSLVWTNPLEQPSTSIATATTPPSVGVNQALTWTGTDWLVVDVPIGVNTTIPNSNEVVSLGSSTNRYKDIYLAENSVYLGESKLSITSSKLVVDDAEVIIGNAGIITAVGFDATGIITAGSFHGDASALDNISASGLKFGLEYDYSNTTNVNTTPAGFFRTSGGNHNQFSVHTTDRNGLSQASFFNNMRFGFRYTMYIEYDGGAAYLTGVFQSVNGLVYRFRNGTLRGDLPGDGTDCKLMVFGTSGVSHRTIDSITTGISTVSTISGFGSTAISIDASLIPSIDNLYELGNVSNRWKDIYLDEGQQVLNIGDVGIGVTDGHLVVDGREALDIDSQGDLGGAGRLRNINLTGIITGYNAGIVTYYGDGNNLDLPVTSSGGGAIAMKYKSSSTTTMSDPGKGKWRLNNLTQSNSTQMAVDVTTSGGYNINALLSRITAGTKIFLQRKDKPEAYFTFIVNTAPTLQGTTSDGWYLFSSITNLRNGGTGIADNKECVLAFKAPNQVSGESITPSSVALGDGGPSWTNGTGSPEGVVTAPVGSLYSRTDGGSGTTLYVKESGTGNTGWAAK